MAARRLASLLARLATFELRLRPDAFGEGSGSTVAGGAAASAAAPTDLLRCLKVCAAHLPRPERPSSLFSEDHLTLEAFSGGDAGIASPLLLGDVLVSVLRATQSSSAGGAQEEGGEGSRSGAWEVVGAVVFHGYGRRPLSALAAIAIAGVSDPRGQKNSDGVVVVGGDDDGERLVGASRALNVAATFVKAEAVAAEAGGEVDDDGERLREAERDLVAVFPAAMLAFTSDDKVGEEGGFQSSRDFGIATHEFFFCLKFFPHLLQFYIKTWCSFSRKERLFLFGCHFLEVLQFVVCLRRGVCFC